MIDPLRPTMKPIFCHVCGVQDGFGGCFPEDDNSMVEWYCLECFKLAIAEAQ
jgi:hypothetical protein